MEKSDFVGSQQKKEEAGKLLSVKKINKLGIHLLGNQFLILLLNQKLEQVNSISESFHM